jgi:DNA processing protein
LEKDNLHYKIALTLLHGIGPRKAGLLVSKLGGVEAVFEEKLSVIQGETGIGKSLLKRIDRENALLEAEKQLEFIFKHQINTHFYLDTNYPRRLRQCPDAPFLLYSKGDFDPNPSKSVAIVGTRNATEYGKSLCEELILAIKDDEIQVVSGMAYGIDICAHQACVRNTISTVGVLGHGLDRIYPSAHRRIAEQMFERGGLLTEFLPGTKPDKENFPMRNRIVAGMTDATIVIESKMTGGSLITAELAFDYNKDVFAYPGNIGQIHSEGCNKLIQQNKAHLITNGNEFLRFMNWENKGRSTVIQPPIFIELTEEEKQVLNGLDGAIEHIDVLALRLNKPVSAISVILLTMELKGILKSYPGNKYGIYAA